MTLRTGEASRHFTFLSRENGVSPSFHGGEITAVMVSLALCKGVVVGGESLVPSHFT